jgi:hypothetical protein
VIIHGREIADSVLEQIRVGAGSLCPRELALELCRWLDWKGPGGDFQVSVAVGVLRRLQELKMIVLSKAQAPLRLVRRRSSRAAPSPGLACSLASACRSLEELEPVELVQVGSRFSRNYRLWRQLLEEYHYLGAGPLAGHQLRYLIRGSGGWLGGLAFSAAALHLEARDRWIGWSDEARRENLPLVINNSRFLILPDYLETKGLASRVLGLAMGRVGQDWVEQFGYRPLLAETFVELERYRGSSYQSANWKLIGMTLGRGRQDRDRTAQLSKKLVLVYPLEEGFRNQLCAQPQRRRLAPKAGPKLAVTPVASDWAEEEFGACDFGDQRLHKRLLRIARDFFAHPTMDIPQACGSKAKAKATYRFFDHVRVDMGRVLQGHYGATAKRAQKEKIVLSVQDTTELNYSAHPKTELLGPICDKKGMIGMLVHDTMAYNAQGTPLGLIDVQCWTRDPELEGKAEQRYELPIEQKESFKWLVSWRAAVALQEQCPESTVISVGDREADVYELLVEAKKAAKAKVLVRATQERKAQLEEDQGLVKIWEWMASRPADGGLVLELPRTAKRRARRARLEVRYAEVQLQAPKRKPHLGAIQVWAVTAVEVGAPEGEEPVEWKLLTTREVRNLEQALEVIGWYAQRFQIEVFHRTLKSGCKIEQRQLGNAERIEGCLAVDMVVAWRIVHLTKLGREVPEVPCTVFFEEAQWKALMVFVTQSPRVPDQPPTLRDAIRMMAMSLGGFLGRKSDGEPGAETIWRGLQRLDDITAMWVVMNEGRYWASPTERELDSS